MQLNRKVKLEYFNKFDLSKGNKPFRIKSKRYFSNKHSKADTGIILNEKGDILFKNKDIADIFKEYLGSIIELLDLHIWTKGSLLIPHTQVVVYESGSILNA